MENGENIERANRLFQDRNFYSTIEGKVLCDYRDYLYRQINDISTQLMYINMELEKRVYKVIKEEPIQEEMKPTEQYVRIKRKEWGNE